MSVKKFLPLILFLFGALVLILVYFLVIKKPVEKVSQEKADSMLEVALIDRPIVSLTPTADGHWLNLKIEKIKIPQAFSMDYELLYTLPDGRTQGVPGTISLAGQTQIERKLLLGSESSGRFRYDEGVKEGTMTVRFRNEKGKLISRFTTKFSLLGNTKELISVDEKFKATLTKVSKGFFVVMETFGVPDMPPQTPESGPYGVFSSVSSPTALIKSVEMEGLKVYLHLTGPRWTSEMQEGESSDSGIFIGASQ